MDRYFFSRAKIRALPKASINPEGSGFSIASDPAAREQWVIVARSHDALKRTLLWKAEQETRSPRMTTLIE